MLSDRLTSGIRVGTLAGATSAGVLVGLGMRHGAALAPFDLLGRAFTARFAGLLVAPPLATALGVVLHFLWMTLWGLCFALFAARLRGGALLSAAVVFAGFVGAMGATVAPGALGGGAMASLTIPQTVFFLALLALALAAGMRFARGRA
jgi:hypothetical protein